MSCTRQILETSSTDGQIKHGQRNNHTTSNLGDHDFPAILHHCRLPFARMQGGCFVFA